MRLGDAPEQRVKVIPTGSLALDIALGIGGLLVAAWLRSTVRNHPVNHRGAHAVASAQALGGIAAFIDAEHALDPEYARNLGVDTDVLIVSQPDTGEQVPRNYGHADPFGSTRHHRH